MTAKKNKTKKQNCDSGLIPTFIPRDEVQRNHRVFLNALDRAIEFHRSNENDPHNVSSAVIVAISEVRDAFKAYMC